MTKEYAVSIRAAKVKTSEAGVLRGCLELLAAERIWSMPINTGAIKFGGRFVRFSRAGAADILCTPWLGYGLLSERVMRPAWIETKSDTGKQSPAQKEFQAEVEKCGHLYLLVRSSDELKDCLIRHGAM